MSFAKFALGRAEVCSLDADICVRQDPIDRCRPQYFPFEGGRLIVLHLLQFAFRLLLVSQDLSFLQVASANTFVRFCPLLYVDSGGRLLRHVDHALFRWYGDDVCKV